MLSPRDSSGTSGLFSGVCLSMALLPCGYLWTVYNQHVHGWMRGTRLLTYARVWKQACNGRIYMFLCFKGKRTGYYICLLGVPCLLSKASKIFWPPAYVRIDRDEKSLFSTI
jgi:hypothetical protein